ncbi:hypothetical protein ACIP68_22995 [Streptomyces griseoviridis]
MFLDQPLAWTVAHGQTVAAAGVLTLLLVAVASYLAHRTSSTVLAAGLGALVCTGFSADTSWRFADHTLHMGFRERVWLFAAGEVVLIVCAVMARANKQATATATQAGTPGVPGVMVWCIATVQIIPAFAESGMWGGIIRTVFGPVMAALLWHQAMGLEIRAVRPDAFSTGLPAQIARDLRERFLSHLGLATRNRTAEEITRDRAHARVVRLASRRRLGPWGRSRLAGAVARTRAAADPDRRTGLLQDLAGRRTADQLRTMDVTSPWTAAREPESPAPVSRELMSRGAEPQREPVDPTTEPGAEPHEDLWAGETVSPTRVSPPREPHDEPEREPDPIAELREPEPDHEPASDPRTEPTDHGRARRAPDFETTVHTALTLTAPTRPAPEQAEPPLTHPQNAIPAGALTYAVHQVPSPTEPGASPALPGGEDQPTPVPARETGQRLLDRDAAARRVRLVSQARAGEPAFPRSAEPHGRSEPHREPEPTPGPEPRKPGEPDAEPAPEPVSPAPEPALIPEPDAEPDAEPGPVDPTEQQITRLTDRLKAGHRLTKTTAAELLGVSPATAGRRLAAARARLRPAEGTGFYV